MRYLRSYRLALARKHLLTAQLTETEIATAAGIFHFGRFAQDYVREFGERPSETLRRRRLR